MLDSAESNHLGPRRLADADLLSVMRERGGGASRATLVRLLDASPLTVSRHLTRLVEQGAVHKVGRGLYALPDAGSALPPEAQQIVEALASTGADAHLTGFDVVGPHSHQFVREYPHLVYCDLAAFQSVGFALVQADFAVFPVG